MAELPYSGTLLVIDDDGDTLALYTLLLESIGYRVLAATSGQAALTQLGAAAIDGVVLDRRLPDGDGLQVCRRLREHVGADVPIVVVSVDRDRAAAASAGATGHIAKPFAVEVLLDWLHARVRA